MNLKSLWSTVCVLCENGENQFHVRAQRVLKMTIISFLFYFFTKNIETRLIEFVIYQSLIDALI